MQIRPFIESLPSLYNHWGTIAMQPKATEPFREILEKVEQPTTANFLQLLTSAAEYLEPGEVICEIGCLNGANLIGVLADHPNRLAYGVDFFSTQAEVAENKIELLQGNLENFGVAEQVCFSHQTIDDFFADLRDIEIEDKFGLYVYNFEPVYRQVLMSLLLARYFLTDQALIIVNNTNHSEVRQAVGDFLNTQSNAKIVLDWQTNTNQVFGSQGLGIIAWDKQSRLLGIRATVIDENGINLFHDNSPVNLYLDLMKKSLMNLIYDNDTDMMRGDSYDKNLKLHGGIWPSFAHTMIGLPRLNNIRFCIEDIISKNTPGDLIETGVWRGGATIFMRAVLKAYGVTNRTVWVADSFEGLPPTKYEQDVNLRLDEVDCLAVSLEEVQSNFSKYGLLDEQVQFLKGWFKDTLPIVPLEQLAILRLDGDWYESTMDALTYLYPKLSIGGYVIIDDYWAVQGCRAAVQDYRLANQIQEPILRIDNAAVYWCRL